MNLFCQACCSCDYFKRLTHLHVVQYSVKRSDVTANPFEWELGENKVI